MAIRFRALLIPALCGFLRAGSVPDFSLETLDGTRFRMQEHLGRQVILVDFWATWCGPCTRLLKKLQGLQARHPEVLVLAVSIDDGQTLAQVRPYVQGRGFTFTILLDPDSSVLRLFNPSRGVPTTLLIDRRGNLAFSHTGYLPGDELELARKLEDLLR